MSWWMMSKFVFDKIEKQINLQYVIFSWHVVKIRIRDFMILGKKNDIYIYIYIYDETFYSTSY
jgi:hypothetical protein